MCIYVGRDTAVNSDSVWGGRSGDRILGVGFSAPVQTGPGVYPASYTMRTGSFLGLNLPVQLYIYSKIQLNCDNDRRLCCV